MTMINLQLDGAGAFPDLRDKPGKVTVLKGEFTIAALTAGMVSGRPSLCLRFDLPDGSVVLQETSVRLFLEAAAAIRGRFGEEVRTPGEYAEWALKLIARIAEDERIEAGLKLEEIKVATRPDDSFREHFNDGDSPEDAWDGEFGAILDSQ